MLMRRLQALMQMQRQLQLLTVMHSRIQAAAAKLLNPTVKIQQLQAPQTSQVLLPTPIRQAAQHLPFLRIHLLPRAPLPQIPTQMPLLLQPATIQTWWESITPTRSTR